MKKAISILLSIIIAVSGISVATVSVCADSNWEVMFDWEDDIVGEAPTSTKSTAIERKVTVKVRDLAQYQGDADYGFIDDSTKGVWFYNEQTTSYNPLNNSPATIDLDTEALSAAVDLRVNIHNKPKAYAVENFYFGVQINDEYYYELVEKELYHKAAYYSFVGKTLKSVSDGTDYLITADDVPNFKKLIGWVETAGWSALLLDNVEYKSTPSYTMEEGSRPKEARVVNRTGAVSFVDTNEEKQGYALKYDCNIQNTTIIGKLAYFSLPKDMYTKGTPSKVTFKIKTDKKTAELESVKAFLSTDDILTINSAYQNSNAPLDISEIADKWTVATLVVSDEMINENYRHIGFVLKSAQADCIYIDDVTVYYKPENDYEDSEDNQDIEKSVQFYRDNMVLEWSDEFNGNSLDENVWDYQPETKHRNREDTLYTTNNARIEDGSLVLTAKIESKQCSCDMTEEEHLKKYSHSKNYKYTTSGTDTQNKKYFSKGLIETRVKSPITAGTWPAVWMCGIDPADGLPHWPYTGEIDIFEYIGSAKTWQQSVLHYYPASQGGYENGYDARKKLSTSSRYTLPSGNFGDGYHVIGMMWTDTHIDFYVDDVVFKKIDIAGNDFYSFRDYEFYFLITFPLGGTMGGAIDDSSLPQEFFVDYIRCYTSEKAEVESVAKDSIVLKSQEGYEYSLDGEHWQSSNVFKNLTPNTEYKAYQRVVSNGVFSGAANTSDAVTVKTLEGKPSYDVTIDSKCVATVDEGETFTLPTFSDENAILYTDGTKYYAEGEKITVTDTVNLKTAKLDISMKPGASIRLDENGGLRFYTDVDKALISGLKENGAEIELGTIITTRDLVNNCDITLDTENVAIIPYSAELGSINEDGFVGSVTKFKQDNIKKEYVARGYVKVTYNGETKVYYASNPELTLRSASQVAGLLKEDITLYNLLPEDIKSTVSLWAAE
ncbi:MAG: glycoside hydrolase family 16 protein [Acutalibacteraceae bacterium]|nr:glycoside hydrolase family 16 protein [Acutalibacteraceae bacterium]